MKNLNDLNDLRVPAKRRSTVRFPYFALFVVSIAVFIVACAAMIGSKNPWLLILVAACVPGYIFGLLKWMGQGPKR